MDGRAAAGDVRTARRRAWPVAIAVVVLVGVLPVVLDRDSFPLSTYPMFSSRRTSAEPVDTAVAIDAGGAVVRLDPTLISGSREVVFAAVTVSRAIREGTVPALCQEIAARVADGVPGATAVEVLTERYDAVRWFQGDRTPIGRVVHGRCEVAR